MSSRSSFHFSRRRFIQSLHSLKTWFQPNMKFKLNYRKLANLLPLRSYLRLGLCEWFEEGKAGNFINNGDSRRKKRKRRKSFGFICMISIAKLDFLRIFDDFSLFRAAATANDIVASFHNGKRVSTSSVEWKKGKKIILPRCAFNVDPRLDGFVHCCQSSRATINVNLQRDVKDVVKQRSLWDE